MSKIKLQICKIDKSRKYSSFTINQQKCVSFVEYIDLAYFSQLQMCRKILKKAYYITQYGCGDEILESHIKTLNIKNIPKNFKTDIQTLKLAAAQNQVLSLSSNQIRMQHRMFAILSSPLIVPGKWINYDQVKPTDYRIIINPILISESSLRLKDFQQCPSIQGLRFHIWNPIHQNYKYQSPRIIDDQVFLEQKNEQLKGFESRAWDHEVRHLQGILALDPSISHMQVSVGEDYQDIPAMHELAQNLKAELRLTSEQNMMKMLKKQSNSQKIDENMSPQQIPEKITKQMKGRMNKHYKSIKKMMGQENTKKK